MKNEDLKELLSIKLEQEFSRFKEKIIKDYTPKEIVEKSYEIAVKGQIKNEILYRNLDEYQIRALLKSDGILNEVYDEWLSEDSRLGEVLENSIDTTLDIIEANFSKVKSNRERER